MSDRTLREAELAWQAAPGEVEAGERYLQACARAGVDPPLDLIFTRVRPGRALSLPPEVSEVKAGAWGPPLEIEEGLERRVEVPPHAALFLKVRVETWPATARCLNQLFAQLEGEPLRIALLCTEATPPGALPRLGPARLDFLDLHWRSEGRGPEQPPSLLPGLVDLTVRGFESNEDAPRALPQVEDRLWLDCGRQDRGALEQILRVAPRVRDLRLGVLEREAVELLPRFERVEALDFGQAWCPLDREGGELLAALGRLRRLRCSGDEGSPLRAGFLAALAGLSLEQLGIVSHAGAAPKVLREVALHPGLRHLDVCLGQGLRDVGLHGWERLEGLEQLFIEDHDRGLTGQGLRWLHRLQRLEVLYLNTLWLTDDHLAHLAQAWSPRLESLTLRHAPGVGEASLPLLRALVPRLRHLQLDGLGLTRAQYEELEALVGTGRRGREVRGEGAR
ncbi:MAG: hypothetical protein AB7N76_12860 [Planctomycetota bacterium]